MPPSAFFVVAQPFFVPWDMCSPMYTMLTQYTSIAASCLHDACMVKWETSTVPAQMQV